MIFQNLSKIDDLLALLAFSDFFLKMSKSKFFIQNSYKTQAFFLKDLPTNFPQSLYKAPTITNVFHSSNVGKIVLYVSVIFDNKNQESLVSDGSCLQIQRAFAIPTMPRTKLLGKRAIPIMPKTDVQITGMPVGTWRQQISFKINIE